MSSYEQMLERGQVKLRAAMEEAQFNVHRSRACNGRADCTAEYHLACCKTK